MEFEMSVDVAAPREAAFDLIADLRAYDEWLPTTASYQAVEVAGSGPVGAGTVYVDRLRAGIADGEVQVHQRPERVVFREVPRGRDNALTMAYTFEDLGGGSTRIHRHWELEGGGMFGLVFRALMPLVKKENRRILQGAKRALES